MQRQVTDFILADPRILDRYRHRPRRFLPGGVQTDAMISIASRSVTQHFGENRRVAIARMIPLLQHQSPCPFAKPKAVPHAIKRTRTARWTLIMRSGDRLHNTEALHDSRGDRRVDAAGDQPVRKPETDQVESIADRVRRTRTTGRDHVARPAKTEIKRHFAVDRRESRAGNVIAAHLAHLTGEVEAILLFKKIWRAAAAPEHNAPRALFFQARFAQTDSGNAQRFLGRGDGQRNRAPYALELSWREIVFRLEILYFTGDTARERFGIERRDGIDAALPTAGGIPELLDTDAVGAHRPQPGYDDPALLRMAIIPVHLDSSRGEMLHFEDNTQETVS